MTPLKMLTADDKIAEIRRLYFETTKKTVEQDLTKALDLLKSMTTEDERERAAVFMEGLAEMRRDWERERKPAGGQRPKKPAPSAARGGKAAAAGTSTHAGPFKKKRPSKAR